MLFIGFNSLSLSPHLTFFFEKGAEQEAANFCGLGFLFFPFKVHI